LLYIYLLIFLSPFRVLLLLLLLPPMSTTIVAAALCAGLDALDFKTDLRFRERGPRPGRASTCAALRAPGLQDGPALPVQQVFHSSLPKFGLGC